MILLKSIDLDLPTKLQDKEYRDVFFEEWSKDEVADQLRRMRMKRKMRQVDLAKSTGMKQSAISRIEQSEYSRWNFVTLLRAAKALNARVRVIFEPAEEVIKAYKSEHRGTVEGLSIVEARKAEMERRQGYAEQSGARNLLQERSRRPTFLPPGRPSSVFPEPGMRDRAP